MDTSQAETSGPIAGTATIEYIEACEDAWRLVRWSVDDRGVRSIYDVREVSEENVRILLNECRTEDAPYFTPKCVWRAMGFLVELLSQLGVDTTDVITRDVTLTKDSPFRFTVEPRRMVAFHRASGRFWDWTGNATTGRWTERVM